MVLENGRNKILVLRLQHEPDNLDLNQICLANYWDMPNTYEEWRLNQSATNGIDVVINVESWTQLSSSCVSEKLKAWKILNYSAWDTVKEMQSFKESKSVCEMVSF